MQIVYRDCGKEGEISLKVYLNGCDKYRVKLKARYSGRLKFFTSNFRGACYKACTCRAHSERIRERLKYELDDFYATHAASLATRALMR